MTRHRVGALGAQLALPLAASPRVRYGRNVEPRGESDDLYNAITALRRAGFSVIRAGAYHQVAGRRLTTRQLLAAARQFQ